MRQEYTRNGMPLYTTHRLFRLVSSNSGIFLGTWRAKTQKENMRNTDSNPGAQDWTLIKKKKKKKVYQVHAYLRTYSLKKVVVWNRLLESIHLIPNNWNSNWSGCKILKSGAVMWFIHFQWKFFFVSNLQRLLVKQNRWGKVGGAKW